MNNPGAFKRKLSIVSRLWEVKDYDKALAEVESLLATWPGNAHLHVLQASLVQLQEDPKQDLAEVKMLLQRAVELDKGSPAAAIELGHFLDQDSADNAAEGTAPGTDSRACQRIDGCTFGLPGQWLDSFT
jgi:predicted Zn-dependent protease